MPSIPVIWSLPSFSRSGRNTPAHEVRISTRMCRDNTLRNLWDGQTWCAGAVGVYRWSGGWRRCWKSRSRSDTFGGWWRRLRRRSDRTRRLQRTGYAEWPGLKKWSCSKFRGTRRVRTPRRGEIERTSNDNAVSAPWGILGESRVFSETGSSPPKLLVFEAEAHGAFRGVVGVKQAWVPLVASRQEGRLEVSWRFKQLRFASVIGLLPHLHAKFHSSVANSIGRRFRRYDRRGCHRGLR